MLDSKFLENVSVARKAGKSIGLVQGRGIYSTSDIALYLEGASAV